LTEQTELTAARVASGSIYLTLQNILSRLIAVSGFAFVARLITQEEMGVIAGLTLLTSLAALILDFGLNSSILKHASELRGGGENISNIVVSATSFRTLTCLIIASTLFITTPNLSETLFNTNVYAYTIRLLSIDACFVGIVLFALLSRIVSRYTLLPKMLSGLFFWIVMDLMGFVSLFFRDSKLTVIGLGH